MKRTRSLALAAMTATALFTVLTPAGAIVYEQWSFRTAGPWHGVNPSCGVGVDGADNVYISGDVWRPAGSGQEIYVIKFGPEGDTLWISYYSGGPSSYAYATDMVVDSQGNTYVTGTSSQPSNGNNFTTVMFNSQGQLLWAAIYDGPAHDYDRAEAVALDENGNVYVTGMSTGANYYYDYATVKYNPQGTQIWAVRYTGPANSTSEAVDLAVDGEGNVYLTGRSSLTDWPNENFNIVTIKYNAQGVQQWIQSYDGPVQRNDEPTVLKLDDQANVYVTGRSETSLNNTDYVALKYNSAGTLQWAVCYGAAQNSHDYATDLAVDTDGRIVVTGYSYSPGCYTTIRYTPEGVVEWIRQTNDDPGYYDAPGLALDTSHNVYVTCSEGTMWYNKICATYKYDAQGDLQWIAKYDPDSCCEEGLNVALDQQGNVIVSGDFYWPEYGEGHPLLIKYNQPAGEFTAAMIPTVTPVVIPANGGSFSYDLQTFNTVQNNLATDFWWKVIYPPPLTFTLTFGPRTMTLPLDSSSTLLSQRVPAYNEPGIYKYILMAGDYPNMVWATDTLMVTKLTTGDGPVVEGGWSLEESEQITVNSEQKNECWLTAEPNPFNPTTAIRYKMQDARKVSLKVYDVSGRLIATLVDGWREAGSHEVTFDGSNLASGVYVYRLEVSGSGTTPTTKGGKMVLMK